MALLLAIYWFARGQQQLLRPHRLGRRMSRACLDMTNNVCVVIALRHRTLTIFSVVLGGILILAQVRTNVPEAVSGANAVTVDRIKVRGDSLQENLEGDAVYRDVIVFLISDP